MWDEWSGLKMTKGLGVWSTLAMEEGTFWDVGEGYSLKRKFLIFIDLNIIFEDLKTINLSCKRY